jgi:pimeloyl-ACP methyl ester carboxylesterase
VQVAERGSGKPALLLHGQPGTGADLDAVARALGADVRTLVPDRPGYGASAGTAMSIGAQARLFAQALVERHAAPCVIAAHSFAGAIALSMALDAPEVVAGLVLAGSVGGAGSVTAGDRILAAPIVGPAASVVTLLGYGQLLTRLRGRAARPWLGANVPEGPAWISTGEMAAFAAEQRSLVRELPGISPRLEEISCPAVVVQGELDLIVSPDAGRDPADRLGAELVVLPRVGHLVPRDAPVEVADAIGRLVHP